MGYKSKTIYRTGLAECLPTCQCPMCRRKRKEAEEVKKLKEKVKNDNTIKNRNNR